jgi:hypothetical protein
MALPVDDVLAIQNLLVRYTLLVDLESAPEEDFLALFTDDAVLVSPHTGRYQGREGQRAYARNVRLSRNGVAKAGLVRHVVTNFRVDGEGDEARMTAYLTTYSTDLTHPAPRSTALGSTGQYDCEVRRVDGDWKMATRIVSLDRVTGTPTDKSEVDHADIPHVLVSS